ncbi:MAG: hypothetical protein IID00_03390 [Chloroflexi bacterium]|nr:hypothetical protein [Chloroflexota bacterium]
MRVRTFPAKLLPAAALFILLLTTACGGDEATPAGTEAAQPVSTSPAVALPPTTVHPPAQPPKNNPTPAATPVPSVMPTVIPAVVATPLPSPTATTPPIAPPTPASAPEPASTPGPSPVPQTAALRLEVTFPPEDMVVDKDVITVTGISSPDATVSINGRLAIPNAEGHFSLELTISPDDNPLAIEVIATSVAGEELSLVRTVIFVP